MTGFRPLAPTAKPQSQGRVLPFNEEAEQHVVGAMILSESALTTALEMLRPEQFYRQDYGAIFEVCRALFQSGQPVDVVTVADEMHRRHLDYEIQMREAVVLMPTTANVARYCQIVREQWGKRELIRAFTDPMRGAWNGARPETVLREVENVCIDLRTRIVDEERSEVVSAYELAERLDEKMRNPPERSAGVPTGFSFLEPMEPGRMYVLGGYAKDGKSVVAVQVMRAALRAGKRVGFVSIEMSSADLADRIIASYGIPYREVQKGRISPPHMETFQRAVADLALAHLDVIDKPAIEVSDILRLQRLAHYDLLIIDHLHRLDYESARDPRSRLNANVKALSRMARSERIPILLLAQLHRPQASDGFPRPTMQSFKETSTIEQEASALWAIYRPRDEQGARTAAAEFLVLADRYGEDLRRTLHFRAAEVRFTEPARL